MRPVGMKDGLLDMINWLGEREPLHLMRIIEIGSYIGESTTIFAEHFGEVISVDPFIDDYDKNDEACNYAPFNEVYHQFLRNTMGYSNIKSIRQTSDKAFELLKEHKWDLVYIDGLHTLDGVWYDVSHYKTLIRKGGYISGHDYGWGNVRHTIGQLLEDKVDSTFQDGSWIRQL